jgi:hypothetical protein
MRILKILFSLPYLFVLYIFLMLRIYKQYKANRVEFIISFQLFIVEETQKLMNKYDKHRIPFSLLIWFCLIFICLK